MRHHVWSPLEVQGVQSFEQGTALFRIRMRTAPVMQWDVARAFNLRLKQRLDNEGQSLAMPRMSVTMENAGPWDAGESTATGRESAPGEGGRGGATP